MLPTLSRLEEAPCHLSCGATGNKGAAAQNSSSSNGAASCTSCPVGVLRSWICYDACHHDACCIMGDNCGAIVSFSVFRALKMLRRLVQWHWLLQLLRVASFLLHSHP